MNKECTQKASGQNTMKSSEVNPLLGKYQIGSDTYQERRDPELLQALEHRNEINTFFMGVIECYANTEKECPGYESGESKPEALTEIDLIKTKHPHIIGYVKDDHPDHCSCAQNIEEGCSHSFPPG
jgi:LmbE family N-acetylglucosaminyl deacetylase